MTHPLKYIGITRDALIDAAKYDPPSAELVTALVEALDEDGKAVSELEAELHDMDNEVNNLNSEIWNLEKEIDILEDQIEELKANQETESND